MKETAGKNKEKVIDIRKFEIIEKKRHEALKKRKNWPAPGVDRITNFW